MTIEISCPQCFANLRVPNEAAGAQAKCPHCSEVFDVHDLAETLPGTGGLGVGPGATPGGEAGTSEPSPDQPERKVQVPSPYADQSAPPHREEDFRDQNNPYASPSSSQATPTGLDKAPLAPGRLDAAMTFSLAWQLFLSNLPLLLMTHTTALCIGFALSSIANTCRENGQPVAYWALVAVSQQVNWFLLIGLTRITLGIARNQEMQFNDLFSGGRCFLRVAIYLLLYLVMVGLGMCLLIVPGLYLAMRYWPGVYFIVDRDVSVMQAFELSSRHTQGNFMQTAIIAVLGVLVLCAGLMVLSYGLYSLLWTIAFLMITRQPIHRGPPPS